MGCFMKVELSVTGSGSLLSLDKAGEWEEVRGVLGWEGEEITVLVGREVAGIVGASETAVRVESSEEFKVGVAPGLKETLFCSAVTSGADSGKDGLEWGIDTGAEGSEGCAGSGGGGGGATGAETVAGASAGAVSVML